MKKSAVISPCGTYRYELTRTWDEELPILSVVMVNPSTADAEVDDPTILRLTKFATRWGFGGIRVVNLFALRSSDPKALLKHPEPVGVVNDSYLVEAIKTGTVLVAWGNNGKIGNADGDFDILRHTTGSTASFICLGLTSSGAPKHPLARGTHRVPDDFKPIPYDRYLPHSHYPTPKAA